MGTPLNDESKLLFRTLADGQWHRYDVIKDAIAKTIPPGRALRKYEDRLKSSRAYRQPESIKVIPEDEKILYGGRACAQITISSWKDRQAIISRSEAGTKWIKMKPGFEPWKLDPTIPDPNAVVSATAVDPKELGKAGGTPEVPPEPERPSEAAPRPPDGPSAATPAAPDPPSVEKLVEESSIGTAQPPPQESGEDLPHKWRAESPRSPVVSLGKLPDCPACGLLMVDEPRHARWHEDQKQASAASDVAIFDEVTLRTLLGDVVRLALDEFQKGMQDYLDHQFVQLEARLINLQSRVQNQRPWTQGGHKKHPK